MRKTAKRRFDRWWIIPPVLLVLVSTLHPFRVHFFHLDPWEGGGFGMFSSIDKRSNRSLRLVLPTENGELNAFLFPWKQDRLRLQTLPDPGALSVELDSLMDQRWALFTSDDIVKNPIILESTLLEGSSFLRTYQSEIDHEKLRIDRYSSVALPEEFADEKVELLKISGNPRLEVYRLVYNGAGTFSSRLITSSQSD